MLKVKLSSILVASFFLMFLCLFTVSVFAQTCTDVDGDGYGLNGDGSCTNPGVDCDDTDGNVYPGAPRICDAKDNDCDGFEDFFTDKDQDGDGVPLCASDCDDNNPNRYPGNQEGPFSHISCSDGIDNDCDYKTDGSDSGCVGEFICVDSDGDGYGVFGNISCPNGAAIDCDDNNGLINPGASDANCNGVDGNCSGTADDGYLTTLTNCGVGECASTGTLTCSGGVETDSCIPLAPSKEGALGHPTCLDTLDNDCDGTTDGSDVGCQSSCLDDDGDGYGYYGDLSCTNLGVDCDDDNAAINPGATDDICDGVDANCSGTPDDEYVPPTTNCGVGECATIGLLVCNAGALEDNCSPLAPGTEGPFGDTSCTDTLDNDCDGLIDLVGPDPDCNPLNMDNDGDGFCEGPTCSDGSLPGDCDDLDPVTYPGASRLCDAKDNDCDGFQDFFSDKDTDGDGSPLCGGDCDDNNANRFPENIEAPFGGPKCSDGIDNDCDYRIDLTDTGCAVGCEDLDGDGYTDANCGGLDCNDNNININLGATDDTCDGVDDNCSGTADDQYVPIVSNCGLGECATTGLLICVSGTLGDTCVPLSPPVQREGPLGDLLCADTLDNDCDGLTDGLDLGCLSECLDDDGDGYGLFGDPSCPNGTAIDCDDNNININPGATDGNCDGVDDNCSGTADDEYVPTPTNCGTGECVTAGQLVCNTGALQDTCTPLTPGVEGPFGTPSCSDGLDNDCDGFIDLVDPDPDCNSVYEDNDGDGFCEVGPCVQPGNLPGDCNDLDSATYPGAARICDGKDNDCDGFQDFFSDVDNDGDGVPLCASDCDDNNPNRYPGNVEGPFGDLTCEDGIDNDCDFKIDMADNQCKDVCSDGDNDGYGNPGHASCSNGIATDCDDTSALINPGATDINCNNVDDNCSGTADDQYVTTVSNCGVGECANTGLLTCTGGVESDSCTPFAPAPEGPSGHATCSDGLDNDCDGLTDLIDPDPGCTVTCLDDDGDGYGVYGDVTCPNAGIDCNDSNFLINPGATDANCDNVDDNCSGTPDDEYVPPVTNCGIGACATTGQLACNAGAIEDNCAPLAPGTEGPSGSPTCSDGIDNDCDGLTDFIDPDPDCNDPAVDDDGDGFCEGPTCSDGSTPGDCDDADSVVHPGGNTTICDGKDTNCDGFQDFFSDVDNDGDGVPLCGGDCNDNDPNRYPGNKEGPSGDPTCLDSIDNDCDNKIDAADADCAPPTCGTTVGLKNGTHMFDLLDGGNNVLKTPCQWCHFDDSGTIDERTKCERCHADPAWGGADDGTLKVLYSGVIPYGFSTALNVRVHSSTVLGTKYGSWDMDCLTCHNPHEQEQDTRYGTSYGKYIKEYICFDNPVTGLNIEEIIEFTAESGAGSFADGFPYNENICEMCHTQTNYHQRTGLSPAHQDGTKCIDCHLHEEGFKPSCGSCHAVPPPTGSHLTHFGGNADLASYGDTGVTENYVSQDTVYIMNCGNCHPIDFINHQNSVLNAGGGDAQIELYNAGAPVASLKALNPPTADYTPGLTVFTDADGLKYTQGTCNNVYCHSVTEFSSNGDVPLPTVPLPPTLWPPLEYSTPWESFIVKTTQYQSPVWGVDSLGCDGCHGYPITLPPTVSAGIGDSHAWVNSQDGYLNMHAWNMGYTPLQCNTCHYNTVQAEDPSYVRDDFSIFFNDLPIHNTAYHVNGTKDIAFNPAPYVYPPGQLTNGATYDLTTTTFFPAGTLYPNEATCVNAPCHQAQIEVKWGTPYREWLTPTECNVCHHN